MERKLVVFNEVDENEDESTTFEIEEIGDSTNYECQDCFRIFFGLQEYTDHRLEHFLNQFTETKNSERKNGTTSVNRESFFTYLQLVNNEGTSNRINGMINVDDYTAQLSPTSFDEIVASKKKTVQTNAKKKKRRKRERKKDRKETPVHSSQDCRELNSKHRMTDQSVFKDCKENDEFPTLNHANIERKRNKSKKLESLKDNKDWIHSFEGEQNENLTEITEHTFSSNLSVKNPKLHVDEEIADESITGNISSSEASNKPIEKKYKCNKHLDIKKINGNKITRFERLGMPKQFGCDYCKKMFNCKEFLFNHMVIHLRQNNLKCGDNEEYPLKENIYGCGQCEQFYRYKSALASHIEYHAFARRDYYFCYVCHTYFPSKSFLEQHEKEHLESKKRKCYTCNKSFKSTYHLKSHLRIHREEKEFGCPLCEKSFRQLQGLHAHLNIHKKNKFTCEVCGKSFSWQSSLIRHRRIHMKLKNFKCNFCNKSFSTNDHLKLHIRCHSGACPYSCDICNKKFKQATHLKLHKNIHDPSRPLYHCEKCKKSYKQKSRLISHIVSHSKC